MNQVQGHDSRDRSESARTTQGGNNPLTGAWGERSFESLFAQGFSLAGWAGSEWHLGGLPSSELTFSSATLR